LSKAVLAGDAVPASTHLFKPDAFAQLNLDWRPGVRVLAIDRGAKLVRLADEQAVPYDKVILCTGGRARSDHVKPGMKIYDEETFGPITTVVRVKGVDEAVSVANDTAYGLSAGVFGRDVARAMGVALQIETGSCHVNGATVQNEAHVAHGP